MPAHILYDTVKVFREFNKGNLYIENLSSITYYRCINLGWNRKKCRNNNG